MGTWPRPDGTHCDGRHFYQVNLNKQVSQSNTFDRVNDQMRDFVRSPANRRLMPGTGSYSALFRGSLFGLHDSAAIAERLKICEVDVLWLGSNPHVSRSLEYILHGPDGPGDFPDFERQRQSGRFGSWRWDGDEYPSPDFSPLERPKGNWRVYRDVLERIARLDSVAMANFIPWGSNTIKEMVDGLTKLSQPLLQRMLAFADEINAEIVQALSPKMIIVPLSLGQNPRVRCLGVAMHQATGLRSYKVTGSSFTFHMGMCQRGKLKIRTAYLPHPASLHFDTDTKRRIVDEVSGILA